MPSDMGTGWILGASGAWREKLGAKKSQKIQRSKDMDGERERDRQSINNGG
jgi:hypothetical protein